MEKGTLTIRMESVSQDFAKVFGLELCRDEVTDAIDAYAKCLITLNHFSSLKSNIGKSLEEIARDNPNAAGVLVRLRQKKAFLDSCLDFLCGNLSSDSPMPCAEDYRAAFAPFLESRTSGGALIYDSRDLRSGAIFDKLTKIYHSFPSPVSYMTDMAEKLGNPLFAKDSLRLRILKQMLLCIDFTDTDINLGELSEYNSDNEDVVASLTEAVFDEALESTISPAADIKSLLRNYADISTEYSDTSKALSELISPDILKDCPDTTRIMEYLRRCLSDGAALTDIFPKESILPARRIIKDEIRTFREYCTASLYEEKTRAKRCLKVAEGKKSAEKLAEYALKCIEGGAVDYMSYGKKYAESLEKNLETYKKITDRLSSLGKTLRKLQKSAQNEKASESEEISKIRSLTDSLAQAKNELESELSDCIGIFRKNILITEERENLKSLIGKRNVLYHNDGGTFDEEKEQRLPLILRICSYLASGGESDTDPYFAKHALYLFAFAFGMKYYTSPESDNYNRNLDMEKKLFTEFYSDNILHFLGRNGTKFSREPSGVGINAKNYRECVYIYFLNNPPKDTRLAYSEAYNMLKSIGQCEKFVLSESTPPSETRVYRGEILPQLLNLPDKSSLFDYITKSFVITRKSTAQSTFRIGEEANTAYDVYNEIRARLDSDVQLFDSHGRSTREYTEDVYDCFEEYARTSLGIKEFTPLQADSEFHRALKLVFLRLNPKNSDGVSAQSITRTLLLAQYFYYFCHSHEGCTDAVGTEFSEIYREFSATADDYLARAGLQKISAKNLFDTVLILLAYIYVNSEGEDTRTRNLTIL